MDNARIIHKEMKTFDIWGLGDRTISITNEIQ